MSALDFPSLVLFCKDVQLSFEIASSAIAVPYVAATTPDGYTLLDGSQKSLFTMTPSKSWLKRQDEFGGVSSLTLLH
jgi:hypothetical protein